jgi:hypothetical protein
MFENWTGERAAAAQRRTAMREGQKSKKPARETGGPERTSLRTKRYHTTSILVKRFFASANSPAETALECGGRA